MSKKSGSVGNVSLINLLDPSPLDALPLSMCGSFIWITIKVSPNLPPHKSRRCVEYKDEYRFDLQKHCQDNDNNNRQPAGRSIEEQEKSQFIQSESQVVQFSVCSRRQHTAAAAAVRSSSTASHTTYPGLKSLRNMLFNLG